jgi:hypothetical protein
MQNIKAHGNKFLVEMKNDNGEYEPIGIISFKQATELQFMTHHAIHLQKVSDLDEDDNVRVGCQLFSRGDVRKAMSQLIELLKAEMNKGEVLAQYDLRNGYSTTETRDLCENKWPNPIMLMKADEVIGSLSRVDKLITEGNLEVYFNDVEANEAFCVNHGIWIKDGKITKVY